MNSSSKHTTPTGTASEAPAMVTHSDHDSGWKKAQMPRTFTGACTIAATEERMMGRVNCKPSSMLRSEWPERPDAKRSQNRAGLYALLLAFWYSLRSTMPS